MPLLRPPLFRSCLIQLFQHSSGPYSGNVLSPYLPTPHSQTVPQTKFLWHYFYLLYWQNKGPYMIPISCGVYPSASSWVMSHWLLWLPLCTHWLPGSQALFKDPHLGVLLPCSLPLPKVRPEHLFLKQDTPGDFFHFSGLAMFCLWSVSLVLSVWRGFWTAFACKGVLVHAW